MSSNTISPHTNAHRLPPIFAGNSTPAVRKKVEKFYFSVASIFESWVQRCRSPHTQRAYREDVLSFVKFLQLAWPGEATSLLSVSIQDVQGFRDDLIGRNAAPKTLNRRISSVSSFYKYLGAAAAELRLPITVPNPAHAQFISRESTDAREETKALSATRARQLMGLPSGDTVLAFRDRAILKLFLYSGIRLSTGCRLKVSDFHQEGDQATLRLQEKGDKRRTIGLHFHARASSTGIYRERRHHQRSPVPAAAQSPQQEISRPVHGPLDPVPHHPELPGATAGSEEGNVGGWISHYSVHLYAALAPRHPEDQPDPYVGVQTLLEPLSEMQGGAAQRIL